MAQLADIVRVEVGPRTLTATVRIAEGGPLMTSEDLEGTTRVYNLMPHIIEHVCLGDAGETFRDVMGNTEIAHLLEHMTVELLAQSNLAGDITSGRTRAVGNDGRTYEIELACADDVLVSGALSSACWMLSWAFSGGEDAEPDVAATVEGLVGLVESLPAPAPEPPVAQAAVVSYADGADLAQQPTSPRLQLVDGGDDDGPASATSRLDGTNMTSAVVIEEGPVPAGDVPPQESPEARQASADVPAADMAATAPVPVVTRESADDEAPLPMPAGAGPSLTGSLPTSQSVR